MHWMILWCVEQIKRLKKAFSDFAFTTDSRLSRMQASIDNGGSTFNQQVYYNSGDPNGVVTVPHAFPAVCVDDTNHIVWVREGGAAGNTGWDSP